MDLKTATSALPTVLVSQYLPITEATLFQAAVGTTVKLASVTVVNTDAAARKVSLSIVKSGDAPGGKNRVFPAVNLLPGQVVDLGTFWLGPGDFLTGVTDSGNAIAITVTGVTFTATTIGAQIGIQDDAIGSGGVGNETVTGTQQVGTGNNRGVYALLVAAHTGGFAPWNTYDQLGMTCADGAMVRMSSIDFNPNGNGVVGSVHLFGRANPSSNTMHTLTGTAKKSGTTFATILQSLSLSGVKPTTGAVGSTAPTAAQALSLPVSSAAGRRVLFGTAFDNVPQRFNQRVRGFDGIPSQFSTPHWAILADALGAGAIAATIANSTFHAAVYAELLPA